MLLRHRLLLVGAVLAGLAAVPRAEAACSLSLPVKGTLGRGDGGRTLGSQEPGGSSGSITIASIGSNTLTISAPTLTVYPVGHNPAADSVEVAYRGIVLLGAVNQAYTAATTSITVPNIALGVAVLGIDNRVRNASGFAPGSYQTRTVITCSN